MALSYFGALEAHRDWVTSLVCPQTSDCPIKLLSASRDKSLVSWVPKTRTSVEGAMAAPEKRMEGHGDFVTDLAVSNQGDYAVSSSWDRSLRLWNIKTGQTVTKFHGHTHDVLTVAFSADNRQIASGGRDGKIKIWNVKGECMHTFDKDSHGDWISCVRFSPNAQSPIIVSGSWDNTVKVWSLNDFKLQHTLKGHTAAVTSVVVSPDGSLCASASKDGKVKLWDLLKGELLYDLDCASPISQICFSPNRYWLVAATEANIRIFDLETKDVAADLIPEIPAGQKSVPSCVSIAWSADGSILYSGYSDNLIRVWKVNDQE